MNIEIKHIVLLFLFTISACNNDAKITPPLTREELIAKKFNERIRIFKNNKIKKCRDKALIRAGKHVHKIMIAEFKHLLKDTLVFPDKPIRPPMPENLYLDTIGVEKIKDFEIGKKK